MLVVGANPEFNRTEVMPTLASLCCTTWRRSPLETKNIAAPGFKKNKQRKALRKLQNTRASAEATRLSLL